jgi:integrase
MPSIKRALNDSIRAYRNDCARRRLTSGHDYELVIRRFAAFLEERSVVPLPSRISRNDVDDWRRAVEATSSPSNAQHCISVVNGWLRFNLNHAAQLTGVRWPKVDEGPGVWLTVPQKRLLEERATGHLRWILHCGVRLGLRREEWLRLRVNDISKDRVIVRDGKGEKTATIPTLTSTRDELDKVLQWRSARLEGNTAEVEDSILVVYWDRKWQRPSWTWGDNQVLELSKMLEVEGGPAFRSHDLRRTCARHLYEAGVPLDHIRRFLRHEELATTLRYVGQVFEETTDAVRGAEARELQISR